MKDKDEENNLRIMETFQPEEKLNVEVSWGTISGTLQREIEVCCCGDIDY